jgi:adenylate kinase family enzyme
VKKYGFIHLSTGDLLREEVKSGSALGKEIDAVIKEGKLISSQLMVKMLQAKIEHNNYGGRYLLDGFPRGQENMDVWQEVMAKWVSVQSVLYFECAHEELKRRLLKRGETSGRNDDN